MSDFLDPKNNMIIIGKVSVIAVALFIVLFLFYKISDQQTKDTINEITSGIGFGKQIIPWVDRADSISRKTIAQSSEQLAATIQNITHPSGNSPALGNVQVSKLNNRILVEMTIFWKGGIIGTDYKTQVAWELSEDRHESARVTFDEAPTAVSQSNEKLLDEYFRTKVYPVLLKNMGI